MLTLNSLGLARYLYYLNAAARRKRGAEAEGARGRIARGKWPLGITQQCACVKTPHWRTRKVQGGKMEIKGILVDINGTLTVGDEPLSGAVEAMRLLKDSGIAVRYTSNIDSRPRSEVAGWLESLGFPVEEGEVFTPTIAAARRLRGMRCHALVNQSVLVDLGGVEFVPGDVDEADEAGAAEAVLVGDVRGDFTYENLDRVCSGSRTGFGLYSGLQSI